MTKPVVGKIRNRLRYCGVGGRVKTAMCRTTNGGASACLVGGEWLSVVLQLLMNWSERASMEESQRPYGGGT